MTTDNIDYGAVLADLKERRAKLDTAIEAIETMMGGVAVGTARSTTDANIRPDSFFQMSALEAAIKYLGMVKKPQSPGGGGALRALLARRYQRATATEARDVDALLRHQCAMFLRSNATATAHAATRATISGERYQRSHMAVAVQTDVHQMHMRSSDQNPSGWPAGASTRRRSASNAENGPSS